MRHPRRTRLYLTSALVGALSGALVVAGLPEPARAQNADLGGTLGIECDRPRRNADGKLILGDDGRWRAMCEADRVTALTYAGVIRDTRDRLREALTTLPPPVWGDLANHLRTTDQIGTWAYNDPDMSARLETLGQSPGADEAARMAAANAAFWDDGILNNTLYPDWQGQVRALACGTAPREVIAVWLDPGIIRQRWTPQMVQRTVRAVLEEEHGEFVVSDDIPDVVVNTGGVLELRRADGGLRNMACMPAGLPEGALVMRLGMREDFDERRMPDRCQNNNLVGMRTFMAERRNGVFVVPRDAILANGDPDPRRGEPLLGQARDLPLVLTRRDARFLTGTTCRTPRTLDVMRPVTCPATINGQAVEGTHVRRFRFREIQNDPDDEFRIDMVPVMRDPGGPNNPLGVIAPDGQTHPVWETTTLFCEGDIPPSDAPEIPRPQRNNPEVTEWDVPNCEEAHGGRFNHGFRAGFIQTITYPDGWPLDDVEIRTIEDHCVRVAERRGQQTRRVNECPEGHIGSIREGRDFRWHDLDFAVPHPEVGTRSLSEAITSYEADPTQAGLEWYDAVTLEEDWHAISSTCREPPPNADGSERDRSETTSFDVDGDGWGDYRDEHHARQEMGEEAFNAMKSDEDWRTGRQVNNGCGSCRGPDDGNDAGRGGGSDRGGGGFWGGVEEAWNDFKEGLGDLWDGITGRGDDDNGGGSGGGGDCFLTTAIVERRGEADDGPTLTALRDFRDTWMANHAQGPALVKEYYEVAPRIVAAIPDDHADWGWIGTQIDRAVACIGDGDPKGAFTVYTAMVRRLKATWLEGDRPQSQATTKGTCA